MTMTTKATNLQESTSSAPNPQANDNSNPQQGTAGATIKIPPTAKDDRKLFVGGLPSDVTEDEFRSFF